ncbi:MAG TPA: hypothetical protein VG389_19630, partial [Myxococcota bacterium]|nr:hypothetical protein [Myxococcota bacterium]
MDRHSISRHARLFAVTCFVVLLTPLLPVAASGLGHGVQPTRIDRGAERTALAWSRPVPADPRISARHEIAETQLLAQRAADQARAAQAHAAAVKAAAAKARAAAVAAARARAARERQAAAAAARQRNAAPTASYGGRNRMWYPALGMSYSVSWFPCSRSRAPDNYVYRWGCAGSNNVYLMAHAWGKFNPLYRAYYGGRLARGQLLVYA